MTSQALSDSNATRPGRVSYWRRQARISPHRDWHTAYAGANWTTWAGKR